MEKILRHSNSEIKKCELSDHTNHSSRHFFQTFPVFKYREQHDYLDTLSITSSLSDKQGFVIKNFENIRSCLWRKQRFREAVFELLLSIRFRLSLLQSKNMNVELAFIKTELRKHKQLLNLCTLYLILISSKTFCPKRYKVSSTSYSKSKQ